MIHICAGPSRIAATALDDRPDRWCFRCRRRTRHRWELKDDGPGPSWYDPIAVCRCTSCGEDHTAFPGTGSWEIGGGARVTEAIWREMCAAAYGPLDRPLDRP